MGADGTGKQELDPRLLEQAELFCDLPAQSVTIGEFQHVAAQIGSGDLSLTAIGQVLTGRAKGRSSDQSITVFDSSGIALQDLHIAQRILQACSL
jgi:ornithine cyclodeaminase